MKVYSIIYLNSKTSSNEKAVIWQQPVMSQIFKASQFHVKLTLQ